MPMRIAWTDALDFEIVNRRASGASWDLIAGALGVGRNAVIDRGRRIGANLPVGDRARRIEAHELSDDLKDPTRSPLPAGHPRAWSVLTDGTLLEGTPYRPSQPIDRWDERRVCFRNSASESTSSVDGAAFSSG